MIAFTTLSARAISMPEDDVDTDIIFPARFLLITEKKGLGRYAFYERRHDVEGRTRAGSLFDQGAGVLIAGANFGCGSSREQAAWALDDLGIRCVIAPSFGEIFYGNCINNGILPIVLGGAPLARLRRDALRGAQMKVDLIARHILVSDNPPIAFAIDDWRRAALLHGWDEVETILGHRLVEIAAFERRQKVTQPWLWHSMDLQENFQHG